MHNGTYIVYLQGCYRMVFMFRMVFDRGETYFHIYLIYMDDLSIALNGCHTGYVVDNIHVNHLLLYADDLVVFAPSISGLKELLKVCDVFADTHDIKYNPNNLSQILISRGKFLSGVTIPPFCIGGRCIPETDTVKYLGHFICNTMRDDTDILRQRRQLYMRERTF